MSTLPLALCGAGLLLAGLAWAWYARPEALRPALLWLNRRSAGLHPYQLTVDGHRVSCLIRGRALPEAGEQTLVLLHGLFAEKDHWVDFVRALPRRYRVVVPDLPGFGESDRLDDARYGYADQLRRLGLLLDGLVDGPVHLAGSSMGGTLAALYAIQQPQQVASLAFIGAPHGLRSPVPSPTDRLIDSGAVPLVARDAAGFEALLSRLFARRPFLPYPILQAARRSALERAPSNRRLWREHVADRYLLGGCIQALRTPLLALWGAQDQVFDVSGADLLCAAQPTADIHRMAGVGHLPMMEAPTRAARLYAGFLAALHGPARSARPDFSPPDARRSPCISTSDGPLS